MTQVTDSAVRIGMPVPRHPRRGDRRPARLQDDELGDLVSNLPLPLVGLGYIESREIECGFGASRVGRQPKPTACEISAQLGRSLHC